MSNHANEKVNDNFLLWLNKKYGSHGEVKANRGKVHDYLRMKFDYSKKGKVCINMSDYMKLMVEEFQEKGYKLDGTSETPAGNDLFSPGLGLSLIHI